MITMPPELIPPDLEGRSALWRSRLAGRRVLILLDNAFDAGQIRPLLPGASGALVLISSRRGLVALEGSISLSLDIMSAHDAVTLFERIVGTDRVESEREAALEVVELCGRLPLAIRIAAARLRDRRSWTPRYLAGELRDHDRRASLLAVDDRSVMAALALSYRHLTAAVPAAQPASGRRVRRVRGVRADRVLRRRGGQPAGRPVRRQPDPATRPRTLPVPRSDPRLRYRS